MKLNYYYISCLIDFAYSKDGPVHNTYFTCVTTTKNKKLTSKVLVDMHSFAAVKFIEAVKKEDPEMNLEIKKITLLGVSPMGLMTEEEYLAKNYESEKTE